MLFLEPHNIKLDLFFSRLIDGIKRYRYVIIAFYFISLMIATIIIFSTQLFDHSVGEISRGVVFQYNSLFILIFIFTFFIFFRSRISLVAFFFPLVWAVTSSLLLSFFLFDMEYRIVLLIPLVTALLSNFGFQLFSFYKTERLKGNGLSIVLKQLYFVQGKKTLRLFVPYFVAFLAIIIFSSDKVVVNATLFILISLIVGWLSFCFLMPAFLLVLEKTSVSNQEIPYVHEKVFHFNYLEALLVIILMGIGLYAAYDLEIFSLTQVSAKIWQSITLINNTEDQNFYLMMKEITLIQLCIFSVIGTLLVATIKRIQGILYYFIPLGFSMLSVFAVLWLLQKFIPLEIMKINQFIYLLFPLLEALTFSTVYLLYTNLRRLKKQDMDHIMKISGNDIFWMHFSLFIACILLIFIPIKEIQGVGIVGGLLIGVIYLQYLIFFPLVVQVLKRKIFWSFNEK